MESGEIKEGTVFVLNFDEALEFTDKEKKNYLQNQYEENKVEKENKEGYVRLKMVNKGETISFSQLRMAFIIPSNMNVNESKAYVSSDIHSLLLTIFILEFGESKWDSFYNDNFECFDLKNKSNRGTKAGFGFTCWKDFLTFIYYTGSGLSYFEIKKNDASLMLKNLTNLRKNDDEKEKTDVWEFVKEMITKEACENITCFLLKNLKYSEFEYFKEEIGGGLKKDLDVYIE